jgi:hypothetical protein
MLRAATWAVGLFGLAMAICRAFPVSWLEPVVLLGLGVAMLWASARSGIRPRRARAAQPKEAAA